MNAGTMLQQTIKYMKGIFSLLLLLTVVSGNAQTKEDKLITTMKEFHQALVEKNIVSINLQTDNSLSYGHSSGWVQTKNDIINDFKSGLISYLSFKEDSIQVFMDDNLANVRFTADINLTMKGNNINIHLKVLEVWVNKGKRWLLFGRQAVR